MAEDKEKLLAAAISQIEKDHGKGAIMRLGSRDVPPHVEEELTSRISHLAPEPFLADRGL